MSGFYLVYTTLGQCRQEDFRVAMTQINEECALSFVSTSHRTRGRDFPPKSEIPGVAHAAGLTSYPLQVN